MRSTRKAVGHAAHDDDHRIQLQEREPGIGRRLDGRPNRDLNVGAIVSLAPNKAPLTNLLGVDEPR